MIKTYKELHESILNEAYNPDWKVGDKLKLSFIAKPSDWAEVKQHAKSKGEETMCVVEKVIRNSKMFQSIVIDTFVRIPELKGTGGSDGKPNDPEKVTVIYGAGKDVMFVNSSGYDYPRYIALN
jgi:hypothetical protein